MRNKVNNQGFTLIELMIVLAIIGILAAIAYPSYTEQVNRGRRADAQSVLLQASQFMERYFVNNNSYSGAILPTGFLTAPSGAPAGEQNYDITVTIPTAGTSYQLTATPRSGGPNDGDKCGNFIITNTGQKSVSTSATDCWGR